MIEIKTINLSAVGTQELLNRLAWSDGVNDTYKMIVAELSNGSKDFHFSSKCALVQGRIELLQEAIKEVADATKRVK